MSLMAGGAYAQTHGRAEWERELGRKPNGFTGKTGRKA
jgi:hypothetical protein